MINKLWIAHPRIARRLFSLDLFFSGSSFATSLWYLRNNTREKIVNYDRILIDKIVSIARHFKR